jgi:CRISPR-associated endonuclease Cas3-HD
MSSACRPEILQFWGKTDKSEHHGRQEHEFHPLAYHLLDVAACADAILDANPVRLGFLADLCEIEPDKLRRTLVCLIALHDLGKCASGFQGKVPELWPAALRPRPEPKKFIPVRHDAAGLWLFKNEPRLTALGEQLISGLLPSEREKIIQSVVRHHGEPLELDFRGDVTAIANSEVQIGHVARLAATELGETIYALFDSFRGVKSLFPHIDKPTPLQLFCEEVALPDGPILFVIEDMTGAGKTEAAVTLAHRLLANDRARGVHVALPTMATANAMFGRLSASYRRLFAPGTDPSVVLVHGRRDLCEGFRSLPRELAYDDHCDEKSADPSEITASGSTLTFLSPV